MVMHLENVFERIQQHYNAKNKLKDASRFFEKLSVLMNEGYTFYDSIHMLAPYHFREEAQTLSNVQSSLAQGLTMTEVIRQFGIASKYLLTLQIAEQRGAFTTALHNVSIQMVNTSKHKQRLTKLLAYPITLFFTLILILVCFRQYFLPQMSMMFATVSTEKSWVELTLSKILLHLPDFLIILAILLCIGIGVWVVFLMKKTPYEQLRLIRKIWGVNHFFKLSLTRQFALELGTLLTSGLAIQDCLDILRKQQYQVFIAYVSEEIYNMVLNGYHLSAIVTHMPFLQQDFSSYAAHGEKGGNLGRELIMYSEIIAENQEKFLLKIMSIIQPLFFCFIAICILGAYLAIFLPMYQMMDFV